MLSQTLRELERDGLLTRESQGGVPPRVDYALTPLGESYIEPLQEMLMWGAKHKGRIEIIRRAYDSESSIKSAS